MGLKICLNLFIVKLGNIIVIAGSPKYNHKNLKYLEQLTKFEVYIAKIEVFNAYQLDIDFILDLHYMIIYYSSFISKLIIIKKSDFYNCYVVQEYKRKQN